MKIKTLNKFKIIAVFGIAIWATLASIGCNTMHGIGTDIEKTGEKIQKESE
jgi:predicted small secreted protein